eukprot:8613837-Alexandrium_andersonii.AAC.1
MLTPGKAGVGGRKCGKRGADRCGRTDAATPWAGQPVGVGASGRVALDPIAQQPADMGGLREGGAVLKKRPRAAIGWPEPTVDRLAGEPGAGLLG